MPIRITGLNSGLDTETIISALVSSYNYKTDKYKKAQTKLSWKQDAWKSLNAKIYSFYTSLDSLRFANNYNLKSTTVSDASKATVTAGSNAVNGTQRLNILKVAQAGYLTGGKLANSTTSSTTLAQLGYTGGNGTIDVNLGDGTTKSVTVTQGTTVSDFISSLNKAGVNANYDENNKRIYVSSTETGIDNDFTLTGSDIDGLSALNKLGLSVSSDTTTAAYKSYTTYYDADDATLRANILAGTQAYAQAMNNSSVAAAQNENLTAAYSYASAYSSMQDTLNGSGLNDSQKEQLKALLSMTAQERLSSVTDADGKIYTRETTADDGSTVYKNGDSYIMVVDNGGTMESYRATAVGDGTYTRGEAIPDVQVASDTLTDLKAATGLSGAEITALASNISKVNSFEATDDSVLSDSNTYSRTNIINSIKNAYAEGGTTDGAARVSAVVNGYGAVIAENATRISEYEEIMAENSVLAGIAGMQEGSEEQLAAINTMVEQVKSAKANLDYLNANTTAGAKKIDGQDALITLNGIEYSGNTNVFSINGLTITAQTVTGAGDENSVAITTQTDVQGMYDKIKTFLTQYNSLINEMASLYNADTARGYEPLTDEEKDSMSDTEVEKWEEKIKDSLLRRDDRLESVMSAMTNSMSKGVEINGKTFYLASFGIKTLGYTNAPKNEQNAFHIDGDADDPSVAGTSDKLMAALAENPDTVMQFMKGLVSGLYTSMDDKMKENKSLSSTMTVYNDKEMASEYSDYTDLIKKWEKKLTEQEDYYYSKFTAMETALAKLNSQSSSLSSLLGG